MVPFRAEGRLRHNPRLPKRQPRCMPDDLWEELFAAMGCNRDRAVLAIAVSTGPVLPSSSACAARTFSGAVLVQRTAANWRSRARGSSSSGPITPVNRLNVYCHYM